MEIEIINHIISLDKTPKNCLKLLKNILIETIESFSNLQKNQDFESKYNQLINIIYKNILIINIYLELLLTNDENIAHQNIYEESFNTINPSKFLNTLDFEKTKNNIYKINRLTEIIKIKKKYDNKDVIEIEKYINEDINQSEESRNRYINDFIIQQFMKVCIINENIKKIII
jgi:hypothetical protein